MTLAQWKAVFSHMYPDMCEFINLDEGMFAL